MMFKVLVLQALWSLSDEQVDAYRSAANERAIAATGRRSIVHFRKPKGRPMSGLHRRANRAHLQGGLGGGACVRRAEDTDVPLRAHRRPL
jgi:hypothetical protein